jgi:hypothetical protein
MTRFHSSSCHIFKIVMALHLWKLTCVCSRLVSSWESDLSVHSLTLPSATCLELLLILSRSNAALPLSLRQMNSFQVRKCSFTRIWFLCFTCDCLLLRIILSYGTAHGNPQFQMIISIMYVLPYLFLFKYVNKWNPELIRGLSSRQNS